MWIPATFPLLLGRMVFECEVWNWSNYFVLMRLNWILNEVDSAVGRAGKKSGH